MGTLIHISQREQQHRSPRPRVFFEEWDEPLIAAIGWVSELIEIAGGDDVGSTDQALMLERLERATAGELGGASRSHCRAQDF